MAEKRDPRKLPRLRSGFEAVSWRIRCGPWATLYQNPLGK